MSVTTFGTPSGVQQYEQLFTSSGAWTVPAGVKTCEVTVVGGSAGTQTGGSSTTAAGGYFKGVFSVDGLSSVAVTVGAAGANTNTATLNTGGTSSFGTLIAAPGGTTNNTALGINLGGAYYFPSRPGWFPNGYSSVANTTAPTSDNGNANGYLKTANGRFFTYLSGAGTSYTTTDGVTWNSLTGSVPPFQTAARKVLYGGGNYLSTDPQGPNAAVYTYYSTNGIAWSNTNLPTAYYGDFTYGPAGWLISQYNSSTLKKSADAVTWVDVTSNLPAGTYYLQSTSTHYYAFKDGVTTAYRSTDGATWTSFTLNAATYASYSVKSYTSYNNKIYVVNGTTTMQEISGTTVTSYTLPITATAFMNFNSMFISASATTAYSVTSPTVPVTTDNFGIYIGGNPVSAVSTETQMALGFNSGSAWIKSNGYAGNNGIKSSTNANANGTSGVLGPGVPTPSTTYAYPVPGRGDDSGWGIGADSLGNYSRTYGSGVAGANVVGNQGVVRVRWWA